MRVQGGLEGPREPWGSEGLKGQCGTVGVREDCLRDEILSSVWVGG